MPALVLDDPAEQVAEHWVPRLADQSAISGQRRKLVDGADRQINGREVLEEPGAGHRGEDAEAVLQAEVGADVGNPILSVELDPIEVQELADVLAVPQLLVVPAGEERCEDGVHASTRHEQVREVQRDVVFDVHHVVQAEEVAL